MPTRERGMLLWSNYAFSTFARQKVDIHGLLLAFHGDGSSVLQMKLGVSILCRLQTPEIKGISHIFTEFNNMLFPKAASKEEGIFFPLAQPPRHTHTEGLKDRVSNSTIPCHARSYKEWICTSQQRLIHLNNGIFILTCKYILKCWFFPSLLWFLYGWWGWQYFQTGSSGASFDLWPQLPPLLCGSQWLSRERRGLSRKLGFPYRVTVE